MARPEVWLNCAVSADGRLAAPDGSPVRISNDADMERVHRMRADADAILVGVGTVLADDPKLTVKPEFADGEHPLRIVLDTDARTPPGSHVLDGAVPTLVATGPKAPPVIGAHQVRLPKGDGGLDLDALLDHLGLIGIRQVMVEGGEAVLRAFLAADRWDRFTVFVGAQTIGGNGPRLWNRTMGELGLRPAEEPLGDGRLITFARVD